MVSAILLAGGRSSRMGSDKASLMLAGQTLLQRSVAVLSEVAAEIVIVHAPGQRLPARELVVPTTLIEDPVEGEGPLIGIAAGLRHAALETALVVAVDMPFLQPSLLRLLAGRATSGRRIVVPMYLDRPQPLCSAFRRDALATIDRYIEAGERRIMTVADDLGAERLAPEGWSTADPHGRSFDNVNTPEEFAAALAVLAGK
jgi:molybdopterin-guanine dinucleotide biosynthesis protein A